jgi:hypothetical protein
VIAGLAGIARHSNVFGHRLGVAMPGDAARLSWVYAGVRGPPPKLVRALRAFGKEQSQRERMRFALKAGASSPSR